MWFFFQGQRYCLSPKEYSYGAVQEAQKSCSQNVPLNANHSHFILIDDGTENKFGGEINFRTSLEKFISEQRVDPDDKESCKWFYAHVEPLNHCQCICCTLEYSCVNIYSKLIFKCIYSF